MATCCSLTSKLTDKKNVRTAILEGFYVDYFLSGCNTLEDAKGLQDELIATLEKAKLPLRKWVSNDQTLVERLPPDMRGGDLVSLFEADSTIRTLGITWQPQKDHFKFPCTLPKINLPMTRRQIVGDCQIVRPNRMANFNNHQSKDLDSAFVDPGSSLGRTTSRKSD